MQSTPQLFNDSWDRIQTNNKQFISCFYHYLIANSEEITQIFVNSKIQEPEKLLHTSILYIVTFSTAKLPEKSLQRVKTIHEKLNISDDHFNLWMESLICAVKVWDPKFSPEVETAWLKTFKLGLDFMKKA
ncbi:MAG: globin [Candidatus Cloacimonetes bacterium]|nr:globin [Candidatus Cloacimonadota bacterium]